MNPPWSVEDLKSTTFLREIPKTYLWILEYLTKTIKEKLYVVLNDVRMADICLALLVYLPCLG